MEFVYNKLSSNNKCIYLGLEDNDCILNLGIPKRLYEAVKQELSQATDKDQVNISLHLLSSKVFPIPLSRVSKNIIQRQQIMKDINREIILINGNEYEGEIEYSRLKSICLDQIEIFSRDDEGAISIYNDMLTHMTRTLHGGDLFLFFSSLLPSRFILSSLASPRVPIYIHIQTDAYIYIYTTTIFLIQQQDLQPVTYILCLLEQELHYPRGTALPSPNNWPLTTIRKRSNLYLQVLSPTNYLRREKLGIKYLFKDLFLPTSIISLYSIPPTVPYRTLYYEIQFDYPSLGLELEEDQDTHANCLLIIKSILLTKLPHQFLSVGDHVLSISGIPLSGYTFDLAIHIIKQTPRPCTIRFFGIRP
ncbi:hypothetical protein WA158_005696 [Blastocystis sp. Blastoise]